MSKITDSAFRTLQQRSNTAAANIAFSKVLGAREQQTQITANYVNGVASYTEASTRNTLNQPSSIIGTQEVTDFVVKAASGMAPVREGKENDSAIAFTKGGSFRLTEDGYYRTKAGHYMVGWLLDENAKIPANSGLLDSLTPVNLNHLTSRARATTTVDVAGNLNATSKSIKGAGTLFELSRSGLNSGTISTEDAARGTDIIIPEDLARGNGSLRQGDRFSLISQPTNEEVTYEFGGIAAARNIAGMPSGLYGARTSGDNFRVLNGGGPGSIIPGDGIRIEIPGANAYSFRAVAGAARADRGEFSSIDSLARAINASKGDLKARVDSNGRLYITQKDANQTMTFTNIGSSELKQLLGLSDIAAPAPDIKRFASLNQLASQIKDNTEVTGITADIEGRAISINASTATSSFTINGSTNRVNNFQSVAAGKYYQGQNDINHQGDNQYTIISANHGLKPGDWVQIGGATGTADIPAGKYMVGKVDSSGDAFSIYTHIGGGTPVLGALTPANGTWEKIAATTLDANSPATAIVNAGGNITITIPGAYAIGDLVYISGIGHINDGTDDISIPDGYYTLTGAAAGDITFVAPSAVPGIAFPPAASVLGSVQVRKVTSHPGGGSGADDTIVLQAVNGEPQVKLFLSNHNYGIGDYIKFAGLDPAGYRITAADVNFLNNDFAYKIVKVTANEIFFELEEGAVSFTAPGASTYGGAVPVPHTSVGSGFRINHYSRAFEAAIEVGQSPDSATQDASYDYDNDKKSLFSGIHSKYESLNGSVDVIDSLGIKHELIIRFAKVDKNQWAVEIGKLKDPVTGSFNDIDIDREDGVLASGTLKFNDTDGTFSGADGNIAQPITLNWTDGSAATTISLNWGETGGGASNAPGAKQGIRQTGAKSVAYEIQSNGAQAGNLKDIDIDSEGFITGNFTNGESRKLFKIPIATFTNINGLQASTGGTYTTSKASGKPVLQEAGGGYGEIISKAVEASNIDLIDQLTVMQDNNMALQGVARAKHIDEEIMKTFFAETR